MIKAEAKSWHKDKIRWYQEAREMRRKHLTYVQEERVYDQVVEKCKNDFIYFVNYWCFTYDPRNAEFQGKTTVPFMLTAKQEEYCQWLLDHLYEGRNGLTEKSRAEGMTWIWCYFAVWQLIFGDGFKTGFGSYKETKVDHLGDLDSIFEKIRFCYRRLPKFMVEGVKIEDNFARIVNRDNGCQITGEVGDDIGRGGRSSIYFVDEHASLANPQAVDNALSENTNCIIYGSTPKGTNNLFYQKRMNFKTEDIFTFHWSTNPLKNDEWYAYVVSKFDAITIAQEVDIDYTASVEGIVIPAQWVRSAVGLKIPHDGVRTSGADVGGGTGSGESVYVSRCGMNVLQMQCFDRKEPTEFALECGRLAEIDKVENFYYDAIGVGAGIAGAIKKANDSKPKQGKWKFTLIPILSGKPATKRKYSDAPALLARDRFGNLRAELWWNLRERFRKTHEVVTLMHERRLDLESAIEQSEWKLNDLISIPNDNELITQLSQPTMYQTSNGSTMVESKEDMRERGIGSPDRADALVYCFSDLKPFVPQNIPSTHSHENFR